MNAPNFLSELLVFLGSGPGLVLTTAPVVIAAGAHFKSLAQRGNGVVGFQSVDALEALLGGSERMPKVFFRMSRC